MISKITSKIKSLADKKYFRFHSLAVMFVAAFLVSGPGAEAATYLTSGSGKFNDASIWSPEYPGNVVEEGDTVIINGNVSLNVDVIIKGSMIVALDAKLTGDKYLIVLDNGLMVNKGITIVEGITNRGLIYNKHIIETTADLINTGKLYNNESMVVGNIMDNTGTLSGNGGHLIANTKLVNSNTGAILGKIDICSANFMNVGGARIDSTYLSFCGNRIFSEIFLTASIKKDHVILSLLNSENKNFKNYEVEKSMDGITYETVAMLNDGDREDMAAPFRYKDASIDGGKAYYRMKITRNDGSEKVLPAVVVGTVLAGR